MGLPQELVDRIMCTLQDDREALEACSLTCKAMFASTRHLVHQTLYVTKETTEVIFTPTKREQYYLGAQHELELRCLSFMGERDLLKCAGHLVIHLEYTVPPHVLEPHLQYLQSLDGVHTLTFRSYISYEWRDIYNTYFTQLYPTLTTLVLDSPVGHYCYVLQFALQFPNLENLTLKSPWDGTVIRPLDSVPPP